MVLSLFVILQESCDLRLRILGLLHYYEKIRFFDKASIPQFFSSAKIVKEPKIIAITKSHLIHLELLNL